MFTPHDWKSGSPIKCARCGVRFWKTGRPAYCEGQPMISVPWWRRLLRL